ncbi:uncharacterized protein LOC129600130 isoform X2 [Paramacrobiotus metropolitanus]|uniref:uncharacterized protein LOC129600130 isoform X2 n=1 Tax=Paramacrobiotus metropolitanus TaxID=2943436 RepID=UPI0024459C76|nr:uncharacterized protein LOC129600130 isoform X2 [Paramacrobiotus metropolitanus]
MDNIQTHMEADCGEYYRICNHLANGVVADHELDDVLTVSVNENAPYSYESPPGSLCFCGFAITVLKDLASEVGLRLFLIPDRNRPEFNTSEIDFHMTGTTVLTYRILQLIYVPWTMLMFAIITTSLTATLSVSTFTFPFRRAEEMFHSDFKLLAREQPPDQSSESIIAETWRDKTVFIPYSLPDSTLINGAINTSQQTAILCPFDEIPTCTNNGIVPVFSWGVSRWVSILQSKKDQPFMGGMKQKMLMLLQTGIPKHLMEIHKIFTYKNKVNAQSLSFAGASVHLRSVFAERPLTVRKLEKTWTGFLFLISLTVIIFLFEVCLKYYIFQVYSHQN